MSWALHHTEPFKFKRAGVAAQVRAALTVSNGSPPEQGSEELTTAIDAAAKVLPLVAKAGDPCFVTITGHEGGGIKTVTVSVSSGQRSEE